MDKLPFGYLLTQSYEFKNGREMAEWAAILLGASVVAINRKNCHQRGRGSGRNKEP